MTEIRAAEIAIVDGLKAAVNNNTRSCEVVRRNESAPVPAHPYISYTITTPVGTKGGTYCKAEDGTFYKEMSMTLSFTTHTDDEDESLEIALAAFNWFDLISNTYFTDHGIVIQSVSNVTSRDSLLTVGYEYRHGFDVTFGYIHRIPKTAAEISGEIETADLHAEYTNN